MHARYEKPDGPEPQDRVVSFEEQRKAEYEAKLADIVRKPLEGGRDLNRALFDNPEYQANVLPTIGRGDPLLELERYAEDALDLEGRNGRAHIPGLSVESALGTLSAVRKEVEGSATDIRRVDAELFNFFEKRLELFLKTFSNRIEEAASALQKYYKEHPGEASMADKIYSDPMRRSELVEKLRSSLPKPNEIQTELSKIKSEDSGEYKARALYTLMDQIRQSTPVLERAGDPFIADIYKDVQDAVFVNSLSEELTARKAGN